jgi:hypothetical protein
MHLREDITMTEILHTLRQDQDKAMTTAIQATLQRPSFRPENEPLRNAPNSIANLSREQLLGQYRSVQAIECEFGIDHATLPQAAAHAAGHVIVAKVMGETICGARLFRQSYTGKPVWLGRNTRTWRGDDGLRKYASENPVLLLRAAINNIAGYFAEAVAGLSHQASNLDERFNAALYPEAIGDAVGLPALAVKCVMADFVLSTLDVHRRQLDVVRGHLARKRRMTQRDAGRMLAGVKEVCVDDLLENLLSMGGVRS